MKNILLHILLIVCYGMLFMQCYNLIATHMWWPYTSISQGVEFLSMNIAAIAIAYIANYWVVFRMSRNKKKRSPILKLTFDIVQSYCLLLLTNIPFLYLMSYIATQSCYIDWIGASFYNAFSLLGMEIVFFVRQYTYQMKTTHATKELLLKYQYDALRAQINPHFLFNSLNIIQALTYENPERATQAIQCLSDIYRYVLEYSNKASVKIADEWNHAQSYIGLLRFRYESNVDINVTGNPPTNAEIVPMTLQILLENIFKHNTISKKKPMRVNIAFEKEGVAISNTIQRKNNPGSTGFGLNYLQNLYGNQGMELKIVNDNSTFTVHIPYLPPQNKD